MKNLRGTILFASAGAALFAGFYTLGQSATPAPAEAKRSGMIERTDKDKISPPAIFDPTIVNASRMITEGRWTFRFDTFGDEAFWGDALKLHDAIQGERFGGVGPGVSPRAALGLGLKVDVDALPRPLVQQLKRGDVNLDDVAVTLAL